MCPLWSAHTAVASQSSRVYSKHTKMRPTWSSASVFRQVTDLTFTSPCCPGTHAWSSLQAKWLFHIATGQRMEPRAPSLWLGTRGGPVFSSVVRRKLIPWSEVKCRLLPVCIFKTVGGHVFVMVTFGANASRVGRSISSENSLVAPRLRSSPGGETGRAMMQKQTNKQFIVCLTLPLFCFTETTVTVGVTVENIKHHHGIHLERWCEFQQWMKLIVSVISMFAEPNVPQFNPSEWKKSLLS